MGVQRQVIVVCDSCKTPIEDTLMVDALGYGKVFHHHCWCNMRATDMAKALYLDDIKVGHVDIFKERDGNWHAHSSVVPVWTP